jgi:anti-sigma B factor antagonist
MTPRPLPTAFRCGVIPERSRVRIAPVGELDLVTTPTLARTVRELLDAGFDHLVIDLGGLEFVDSTALRLILDLHTEAAQGSFRFGLIEGPRAVQRIFELSATEAMLPFEPPRYRKPPFQRITGAPRSRLQVAASPPRRYRGNP